ncbi:MAG: response regulator [Nitrospiraceae bacterium]
MTTILIIDDEEPVQTVLRHMLEEAGYTVRTSADGRKGLQQFRQDPADLVLLDILMPEKEGLETLLELRREYPTTKVIAISGGGARRDFGYLDSARLLGAHSVLTKPIDRNRLLREIARVLESPSSSGRA